MSLKLGIEVLKSGGFKELEGKNVALLSNPASVDKNLNLTTDILMNSYREGIFKLVKLFGPQQGFFEVQQANMIEWEGNTDNPWSIPLHSLYGTTRKPSPEMLEGIDCFVVDLQDVGSKGYTFISTLYYVMEACEETGIELVVLDRPNPLGGTAEGPITKEKYRSFVGIHNLPLRHGLTFAEAAQLFKKEVFPSLNLRVVKMRGYKKLNLYPKYKREWIATSPNVPTFATVLVYPGMELFEGTNLSEGRGTTKPFEQFGAPFIDSYKLTAVLNEKKIPGVRFRPISFTPTFDKFDSEICYGSFIHVTDPLDFSSVRCALSILETVINLYSDKLLFKEPPYEYEEIKLPFDILAGNGYIRTGLQKGEDAVQIEKRWRDELKHYEKRITDILIYD